jgi:hypothetical protein
MASPAPFSNAVSTLAATGRRRCPSKLPNDINIEFETKAGDVRQSEFIDIGFRKIGVENLAHRDREKVPFHHPAIREACVQVHIVEGECATVIDRNTESLCKGSRFGCSSVAAADTGIRLQDVHGVGCEKVAEPKELSFVLACGNGNR